MTDEAASFLDPALLVSGGPRRFVTQVERLLWHLGFDDVRDIDGPGDEGGDILALRGRERWAVQCKWRKAGPAGTVDEDGVLDADRARRFYRCEKALLVTNARLSGGASDRLERLARVGAPVDWIDGARMAALSQQILPRIKGRYDLREYQRESVRLVKAGLDADGRALLVLATGLGKTVVGATIIADHLERFPGDSVLVVAHMKDLVAQLEKAMWRHVSKSVPTHLLTGDHQPDNLNGVVCGTVESALGKVLHGWRPGLVMVDETHHLASTGMFADLLGELDASRQFGVTATPWRGDKYDIESHFGTAVKKVGIADGMRMGYLAQVDYRLMVDDVDRDAVQAASEHDYTIKELNRKLFLPQRDEAVADNLLRAWNDTPDPRCIVFCETIEHAERFAKSLRRLNPDWDQARPLHAGMAKRDRDVTLAEFRRGDLPVLCAVDVLNEGIDVPDVNIIVFLRVTHSRRIFVQQLGRGLRLREGKKAVTVLDFVSDLRRVAEVYDLKRNLDGDVEEVTIGVPSRITFSDARVESLMQEWIEDAASLATANDQVKLNFPSVPGWSD